MTSRLAQLDLLRHVSMLPVMFGHPVAMGLQAMRKALILVDGGIPASARIGVPAA